MNGLNTLTNFFSIFSGMTFHLLDFWALNVWIPPSQTLSSLSLLFGSHYCFESFPCCRMTIMMDQSGFNETQLDLINGNLDIAEWGETGKKVFGKKSKRIVFIIFILSFFLSFWNTFRILWNDSQVKKIFFSDFLQFS